MARLAIEASPAVAVPRRFLHAVAWWGMFAGATLCIAGPAALHARWHPAALTLTHAFTLGVLANAMFGSLLQFLPAAGGVHVRGGMRCGSILHLLLNFGTAALASGLYLSSVPLLRCAAVVLPAAFVLLAAMTLPGLMRAGGQWLLRAGIGAALAGALITAGLGLLLAWARSGQPLTGGVLPRATDLHAAWGVLGWVLLLIASVSRTVMPMFLGSANLPAPLHALWLASLLSALLATTLAPSASIDVWSRVALAALVLLHVLPSLFLHARGARGLVLRAFTCAGLVVLAGAAVALVIGEGRLAGVLAIGIGLPLLVLGMLLQISAFLAWIELQRRCGRGVRVPGIQQLSPDGPKWHLLGWLLVADVLLAAAAWWPEEWLARAAGLALLLAYMQLHQLLGGVRSRVQRFTQASLGT